MKFTRGQVGKFNKSTMLGGFSSLPHGLELLDGNVHDQDAPPNGELVMSRAHGILIILISPLDPRPPWSTLTELQASACHYIHQAWHILPSPNPQSLVNLGNGPPSLSPLDTRVIQWDIPKDGICLFELFGSITSG
jgi:hypothetical protein